MRWGGNDAPHCIALALIGFGFLTPVFKMSIIESSAWRRCS
jgi:hypothetical protein